MNVLRRQPSRTLVALVAGGVVAVAIGCAVAVAALTGGAPPAEPLDQAISTALAGPPPAGITAEVSFENHLFDAGSLPPFPGLSVLAGASGRLWIASDGHVRLDLNSSQGEVEIAYDGSTLTLYDVASNTAYELALPAAGPTGNGPRTPPTLSQIDGVLSAIARYVNVSAPTPGTVADEPAYTFTVTPIVSNGPAPSAAISFDASTGVPLQFTLLAAGSSSPALALTVTSITYGPVEDSDVDLALPAGATVVPLSRSELGVLAHLIQPTAGPAAVSAAVPFTLAAPATLAGLPRGAVRAIGSGPAAAALISYGEGSERLQVLEIASDALGGVPGQLLDLLPSATVGGTSARELVTGFGTILGFSRDGVSYTLAGSLDQTQTEAAAEALGS